MKAQIIVLLAALLLCGRGSWSQEKKHYLTPAEVVKVMNESATIYKMEGTLAKLKPEERQDLAAALFPPGCAAIDHPRLVREQGRAQVQ
jgi:hypothetical protein